MSNHTKTLDELVTELPPEGRAEVRDFAEFLVKRKTKTGRHAVLKRQRGASPQEVLELIRSLPDIPAEDIDELMRLINVMLSKQSVNALLNRLKQVAREFSEQHQEDAKLPFEEKHRMSFMLAARPWLPAQFKSLVRKEYIEQYEEKKNKKKL